MIYYHKDQFLHNKNTKVLDRLLDSAAIATNDGRLVILAKTRKELNIPPSSNGQGMHILQMVHNIARVRKLVQNSKKQKYENMPDVPLLGSPGQ